ncbi:uncharacterized protein LAESUDRAFT_733537 [Laetiporus sulphureus 93-53]|uniref:Dol-P-Man:Man(5)GlcNAc(2)-PP-Dol alpha-1,3-mannosyltransferase n=1 Tax=Laetiporus sulphureus 93-53 TaxID=1314785 RepID=A0A165IF43_9APHY|nr:uncharacterized protein LAESUDRAFT_733537 [Laetiporus sulphureus 93-53]KZT12987.1 hypothetical protein LAESUDRAFT_733537 [Laetiporus sulphureus 93-53]
MVAHLPPAIKQLLTLRNPRSLPGPPVAKLNEVLTRTFNDAQQRKAEKGWLTLTTCTLLTANVPPSVGHLYRFTTRDDPSKPESRRSYSEALQKAAWMREAAMKSSIFVGVPRTILSFAGMFDAFEDDVKKGLRKEIATPENVEAIKARGQALWDSIYEPHAVKLYNKLGGYHPDFIAFIIQAYGAVLSPLPGGDSEQGNLSRALGSVVGTACLRAEGGVGPQLVSHVFGLLKARNVVGLSEEDYWLATDEGTEWVIRTVDTLIDVVRPEGFGLGAKL